MSVAIDIEMDLRNDGHELLADAVADILGNNEKGATISTSIKNFEGEQILEGIKSIDLIKKNKSIMLKKFDKYKVQQSDFFQAIETFKEELQTKFASTTP